MLTETSTTEFMRRSEETGEIQLQHTVTITIDVDAAHLSVAKEDSKNFKKATESGDQFYGLKESGNVESATSKVKLARAIRY